jgi:hypothetical protein
VVDLLLGTQGASPRLPTAHGMRGSRRVKILVIKSGETGDCRREQQARNAPYLAVLESMSGRLVDATMPVGLITRMGCLNLDNSTVLIMSPADLGVGLDELRATMRSDRGEISKIGSGFS